MNKTKQTILSYLLSLFLIITIGMSTITIHGADFEISDENGTLTASVDEQYINITYEGKWDYNINETIYVSVNGQDAGGANSAIVLNSGNNTDSQILQVKNAWYQEISGAEGSVTNYGYTDGSYETVTWQIKIPVAAYGENLASVGLTWSDQTIELNYDNQVENGDTTTEEENNSTEETTEEDTEEVTTEDNSTEATTNNTSETGTSTPDNNTGHNDDLHVTSGLVIDGYYADWKSYPVTEITYTSNNAKSVHIGQIYSDGERVYVHFAMNDLYTGQMQVQQMTITINGESHSLGVYPVKSDGSIDWDFFNNHMNSLSEGIHMNLGVIVDYTKYCDSQAAMTVYDASHSAGTRGDELEFSFSIEDFSRITGMNLDDIGSITIVNPNIGSQDVTWVGTSTAPWLGALIALLLAGAGICAYKGNKEEKRR